jgi:[acyl-carrier-protein] S-malonyltransferase
MGNDLYDEFPEVKSIFDKADEVLGWSVKELCFNGPDEKLTESRYCQPAIYTMSVACLEAFKAKYPEVNPESVGGLSLGEFAALYAAGVFTFEDGLKLVARRGELMDEACKSTNGGMASVLGGELDVIKEVCEECDIDVANYNCPGQIVISGEKEKVDAAVVTLKEKGFRRVIPLSVAGAYHSRLMATAGEQLKSVLVDVVMEAPEVTLMQNFPGGSVANVEDIKSNLVSQVAGSVRWEECVREMISMGVDTVVEFGPGNVLTGLAKRTDKSLKLLNVNSVASFDKLSEVF